MNILYLTAADPRSVENGMMQRSHHLWLALSRLGVVHTVCRRKDYPETELIRHGLDDDGNPFKWVFHRVCRRLFRLVHPVFGEYCQLPFPVRLRLQDRFPGVKFDLIVVRYLYRIGWIEFPPGVPVCVDVDDWPGEILSTDTRWFLRWRTRFASVLLDRVVRKMMERVDGAWVANGGQLGYLKVKTAAELVNIPKEGLGICKRNESRCHLLTIGAMSYAPNYRGVDRFVKRIWRRFHDLHPELEYVIVGRGAPRHLVKQWSRVPGVRYLGYVEDVQALYDAALCTVVPVQEGGGTCIKTIESLARGRVCVSTRFGLRGLDSSDAAPGRGMVAYEDADSFERQMRRWVLDDRMRTGIEDAARTYATENHSFAMFFESVARVVEEVVRT